MKIFCITALILSFVFSALVNPFTDLEKLAAEKIKAKSRVVLSNDESLKSIKNADVFETVNVPNYIRALSQKVTDAAKNPQIPQTGLGITIANSQRAMLLVPDLSQAWRDYGTQNRNGWMIDRNIQLQISFAVSMANGCRYCTLHQILGLRRLGVDPKKLLVMKKDDSMLTPRELIAVEFTRKLTNEPASITDADFDKLKVEFTEQGAVEVVLQTCNLAFMNRFTDNLRLPSEDEAVKTYKEVYGEYNFKY